MLRRLSRSKATPSNTNPRIDQPPTEINSLPCFSIRLQALKESLTKISSEDVFSEIQQHNLNDAFQRISEVVLSIAKKKHQQAFVSHYKAQAGTSAQLFKSKMEKSLGITCFLDSDNLANLNDLPMDVVLSCAFFLLMSPFEEKKSSSSSTECFGPFGRQYCLVEIITWFLNRGSIKAVVVWQVQEGLTPTRFPSTQSEVNSLLPCWDEVRRITGQENVQELTFQAILVLQKEEPNLKWAPNSDNESNAQMSKIWEAAGLHLHVAGEKDLKSNTEQEDPISIPKSQTRILQISIVSCTESVNEAALLGDRTVAEFGDDQVQIVNDDSAASFVFVLLSPAILEDESALKRVARVVNSGRDVLLPITLARIGLENFDFGKPPRFEASAFNVLTKALAKPLHPHAASDVVTAQLRAIWAILGLTNSRSQFPKIPFLIDPYAVAEAKASQFAPKTREWVFRQITGTMVMDATDPPVFVLVSTAGLGKSVIQAEFCRRFSPVLRQRSEKKFAHQEELNMAVVALHFFKHDNKALSEAKNAIGSIARQLACTVEGFRSCLESSLATTHVDELKSLDVLFRKAVLEPAIAAFEINHPKSRQVIVMDALDECEDRHELIPLLAKLWPSMPMTFGLVLTTRPDVEVPCLEKFRPAQLLPDAEENRQDIATYIAWALGSNSSEAVVELLAKNASGMFLYISFACKQLTSASSPQEVLNRALKLPVSMTDFYVDMFSTLQNVTFKEFPIAYFVALALILASRVPLPEDVWRECCLLALRSFPNFQRDGSKLSEAQASREFERLIKAPLVRLLDFGGAGGVSVIHKSMDDFLRKSVDNVVAPSKLQIDASIGHEELVRALSLVPTLSSSHFAAAHGLFHCVSAGDVKAALKYTLSFDRLLDSVQAGKKDGTLERMLFDVDSVLFLGNISSDEVSLVRYALSFLQLSKNALIKDPRQLAGQILGRSMCPPFEFDQNFWVDQVNQWLDRARSNNLKIAVPIMGKSGLAPAGTGLLQLLPHSNQVTSVAISIDGVLLVTGTYDHIACVWDAKTGKRLRILEGHSRDVTSVAISTDATFFVTGSDDNTARVWDAKTGKLLQTLNGHSDSVASVTISSDGTFVVTGSSDKTICMWDAKTGNLFRILEGHSESVTSVAISGSFLASGSDDKTACVWDAKSGQLLRTLEGHSRPVTSVAISSDETFFITGSKDNTACMWDANSGKLLRVFKGHLYIVTSVSISVNGTFFVMGSWNAACIYDVKTGKLIRILEGHSTWVSGVAISTDGAFIVTGSNDKTARVWDAKQGKLLRTSEEHSDTITSVAISTDGTFIATGSLDKTTRVWDAKTGKVVRVLEGHSSRVTSVAISSNGTFISTGSRDNTARVWDTKTGGLIQILKGHSDLVNSVVISTDGKFIATASCDKTARVWDTVTGKLICTLEGHSSWVNSVAISTDGTFLVTGSRDETARVWDAKTGKLLQTFAGQSADIMSVAISTNNNFVKCNSDYLWDLSTGERVENLRSIEFSCDISQFCVDGEIDCGKESVDFKLDKQPPVLLFSKGSVATWEGKDVIIWTVF